MCCYVQCAKYDTSCLIVWYFLRLVTSLRMRIWNPHNFKRDDFEQAEPWVEPFRVRSAPSRWQQESSYLSLTEGNLSNHSKSLFCEPASAGNVLVAVMCVTIKVCVCPPDSVYALGACVCQDVSSFGNSLSRCVIFRQVTRPCIHCLF